MTGHTYYARWEYGLDFENMDVQIIEPLWNDSRDKDIIFEMPFYDVREAIHVDPNGNSDNRIANDTIIEGDHNKFGANWVYNETHELDADESVHREKRLRFAVAGKSPGNEVADSNINFIRLTG